MSRSVYVDFKAVKAAVSMSQIIDHYGLAERLKRSGLNLSGCCPIHDGQNPSHFRVNLSKNCWNCFGECKGGGNILDFVAKKEGVSIREAALQISEWFDLPAGSKPADEHQTGVTKRAKPETSQSPQEERVASQNAKSASPPPSNEPNRPLGFALKNLDPAHPYLAERGLNAETIAEFGVGFCASGTMTGRIVIPIHNGDGELVAYAGRLPGVPPDKETTKYKLPTGFLKMREVFNLHRALQEPSDEPLFIVEGFFDAMILWQHGIRRVVALMGWALSPEQEALIVAKLIADKTRPSTHIVLMLDEDDAGREARLKVTPRLAAHCYVRTFRFELEGQQPDTLTAEQIAEVRR